MKKTLEKNLKSMSREERNEAIGQLDSIVDEVEKYRSSYWWTPSHVAAIRYAKAFEHKITVQLGTDTVSFVSNYSESCKNCYYTKDLCFNGNRTNITLLKNIIAKLEEYNSISE